ncbi:MAG TPA: prolyl oligopeptidase family serine peptidase [Planctomycetota bacterium]|nr:prolyl oligopeptidase family serine peptidase [Planctomycetota bacterium]
MKLALQVGRLALVACSSPSDAPGSPEPLSTPMVPVTQRIDHLDDYHGVSVADPYRWLEQMDSPETRSWIASQNEVTFGFLRSLPQREAIRSRLEEVWNYPKWDAPFERKGRIFQFRNDGLQNHAVLYVREGSDGTERVLLDPNALSSDGSLSLNSVSVSEDGELLAWGFSKAGSDWTEWRVRRVATGEDLDDHLRWVKFSGATWSKDGKGFYYSRYPEPPAGGAMDSVNKDQALYYHTIGEPQERDTLVYSRPDEPNWGFSPSVSEDGRYVVISCWAGTDRRNRVFLKDLNSSPEVRPLLTDFDAGYTFVGNDGETLYFFTDLNAPRGRLIALDATATSAASAKELIPEGEGTISSVRMVHDRFVVVSMHHAADRMAIYSRNGALEGEVPLPGIGSIGQVSGRRRDHDLHFTFSGFTSPSSVYRAKVATREVELLLRPPLKFENDAFVTSQVWYPSKDGTRIPMFLVHRKDLDLSRSHPTYLYGYGGFNVSLTPQFSPAMAVWMERGGIFAQPSLRGGGEFGEEWHAAGMLHRKQNVFDDFIAAAEWLIQKGHTTKQQLAIAGGSNGGLLVGAAMTQRPDLFGACLPAVGVMDMLRFHQFTIGWAWVSEYGSSEDPEHFRNLLSYSPLHNLKAGTAYPPTLVLTADHDDRVVPCHSFKFAAALQAAQGGDAPCLIRIETEAGHGAGIPTAKRIDESADRLAFAEAFVGNR